MRTLVRLATGLAFVLPLAGCSDLPSAHTIDDVPLNYGQTVRAGNCSVRFPAASRILSAQWSGACDSQGLATGPGTLVFRAQNYTLTDSTQITAMQGGMPQGHMSLTEDFVVEGRQIHQVTEGNMLAGQFVGISTRTWYESGALAGATESNHLGNGKQVFRYTYSTAAQNTPSFGLQMAAALASGAVNGVAMHQNAMANASPHVAAQAVPVTAQRVAANTASPPPVTTQHNAPHSQVATQCVYENGNSLVNNCAETISVVWCVQGDGSTCDRGLDNESDIPAGGSITALPLKHAHAAIKVTWFACTGSNTATAIGWQTKCD